MQSTYPQPINITLVFGDIEHQRGLDAVIKVIPSNTGIPFALANSGWWHRTPEWSPWPKSSSTPSETERSPLTRTTCDDSQNDTSQA
ncbi:MAG: hypothetical protein WEB53_17460 [Akkermansiaceae bacterium]